MPLSFGSILGVVLLAGCATATAGGQAAASGAAATASRAAAATSGSRADQSLAQRAALQAKSILRAFVPPPGAVRLAGRPKLPAGAPSTGLTSATQRDAVGYWRAPGTARDLLSWEKAHISRSFSRRDVLAGPPSWSTLYTLPAVPGALPAREMNVQFYDVGGGVVIMADAMVSWQPPRPAGEVIPASVTAVTIAPWGGMPSTPKPVTITAPQAVRQIRALVNALPLSTAGPGPCPGGLGLKLTFRTAPGAAPAAVATGPGACGDVALTIAGQDQPELQATHPGAYNAEVLRLAGLRWKLP